MKLSSFLFEMKAAEMRSIIRLMELAGIKLEQIAPVLNCAEAFDALARELKGAGR